ncbi:MAG: MarR family transcriptional regulator [Flavobacteriaceae bacterium]|jgi:DNA-binding MarR family transcriptional regulator|nr:MarR family transcriptional regulator [Flavobacteriaceae bacterium]|tara:strand:- start:11854 stop:12273 length:420 start_codon:yes stop_codon:yes gene_type:complete
MEKLKTFDYALRSTWQSVANMYNKEACKYDSTMSAGFALLSIESFGTPSTALGPKMGIENTSLSRLLNSLEEKRLIERKPNPKDGRGRLIYLTKLGFEKRELSKKIVLGFNKSITNKLSKSEINTFFKVINCINTESQK